MIDCHAHLALVDFDGDRQAVLQRARQVGIERIVVVGEDLLDDRRVLEVCAWHSTVLYPLVGLHPDRFAEERPAPSDEEIEAVLCLAKIII